MSTSLVHLANRVAADPFFLAHPLAEFARSEALDDAALAARLGCAVVDLARLRLCRAPRLDAEAFREDITQIAQQFKLAEGSFTAAVRHGQGLIQMRDVQQPAAQPGFLLAARDRTVPPKEPLS